MSLIAERYIVCPTIKSQEEIFKCFCMLVRLLEKEGIKKMIMENTKNDLNTVFIYNCNKSEFDYSTMKHFKNKDHHHILYFMFEDTYSALVDIEERFLNVNFKPLISRKPIFKKYWFPQDHYPDFDIYETNNKYKFRFPCTNQDCINRESLTSKFSRCSQCLRVQYCSKQCQAQDWKSHKPYCKK